MFTKSELAIFFNRSLRFEEEDGPNVPTSLVENSTDFKMFDLLNRLWPLA